jgi:hypothetical protein
MAAMPLFAISIYLFLAVEIAIIAIANFLFLGWFGSKTFTALATLIAFDLLTAGVLTVIALATHFPDNGLTDYLIAALGVPAIAYPVLQAFFLRDQWSSES